MSIRQCINKGAAGVYGKFSKGTTHKSEKQEFRYKEAQKGRQIQNM
jgi:hypothetical protein